MSERCYLSPSSFFAVNQLFHIPLCRVSPPVLRELGDLILNLSHSLMQGVHLSGIMAILFCGLVMSHYTHYNLSPVTQVPYTKDARGENPIGIYVGQASCDEGRVRVWST